MTNTYSEQIQAILSPLVGDFIAKMAVNFQCKAIGITPDGIEAKHLNDLSVKIGEAMAIQGKGDQAEAIVAKILGLK